MHELGTPRVTTLAKVVYTTSTLMFLERNQLPLGLDCNFAFVRVTFES